jgi:hypothetical protein
MWLIGFLFSLFSPAHYTNLHTNFITRNTCFAYKYERPFWYSDFVWSWCTLHLHDTLDQPFRLLPPHLHRAHKQYHLIFRFYCIHYRAVHNKLSDKVLVWCDTVWCDVIWYDIWYDIIWYDMMIWYDDVIWWCDILYMIYDMIWYDVMWYMIYFLMWFIRHAPLHSAVLHAVLISCYIVLH